MPYKNRDDLRAYQRERFRQIYHSDPNFREGERLRKQVWYFTNQTEIAEKKATKKGRRKKSPVHSQG